MQTNVPTNNSPNAGTLVQFSSADIIRDFPHIARGSFGIVFKGTCRGLPGTVVIKDLEVTNQQSVEDWKKELMVMSKNINNPYCAKVFGYTCADTLLTIVMEYFPLGDLFGVMHKHPEKHPLSLIQRMRMARHVALSVAYLHDLGFIHRDIKSMNILVTADYECKLTDFGCAKLIAEDNSAMHTVASGTPLWMAPEVKRSGTYSFSADVYSVGLVLYEIFERKIPEYDATLQTCKLPKNFMSAPVVMPCLNLRPEARPTAKHVVSVVDKMIQKSVLEVQKFLPPAEQALLKQQLCSLGTDSLDNELVVLYRHLLTKPAQEADALLEKAFGFSIQEQQKLAQSQQAMPLDPTLPQNIQQQQQMQQQPMQILPQQQNMIPQQQQQQPIPSYPINVPQQAPQAFVNPNMNMQANSYGVSPSQNAYSGVGGVGSGGINQNAFSTPQNNFNYPPNSFNAPPTGFANSYGAPPTAFAASGPMNSVPSGRGLGLSNPGGMNMNNMNNNVGLNYGGPVQGGFSPVPAGMSYGGGPIPGQQQFGTPIPSYPQQQGYPGGYYQ